MQREVTGWYSPALNKNMDIAVYGHYGIALLMIPTAASDYLEYEQNGLIESIAPYINAGKVKVYCINSINAESWLNPYMHGYDKAVRHQLFNDYVIKEVIPFIKDTSSQNNEIIAAGASFGAMHAANLFFKHPDYIHGIIAMSGCYDLSQYTDGYYDDNVYFNSPVHYLPQLKAEWHLSMYRDSRHIHFVTGSGAYEVPEYSRAISSILTSKNVPHELDIWGPDMPHEWWVWKRMLPYYLETRF
ncbi:esterase family protein [Dyadobacter psychrophilus]|uniref:Esterase/lipase superfamily enzyme n=1 Tax=Dyadobacter psychrophilus TaxID=651661 RepID=A0A1T5CE31_9BACT|nr:alpha/beta hydrolase-fold protein [Dyadobacter psychrophilus]SKB57596.1 Esterase/lipase superfamily enzyme [Dyadobacter psychrophilus]